MISLTHKKVHYVYMKEIAVAVFFCIVLVSCVQVSMEDVSSNPEYSNIIGKKFRVKEDLWALGITTDPNYKKRIDYIVLVPGVGFSGPEVVTRERLNSGSTLRITRIMKASSPMFSRMAYVVEEVYSNRFRDYEVRVDLTGDVNDKNYGLDDSIYSVEDRVPQL